MKLKHLLGASALAALPMAAATAQDAPELPPCENCADSMTIVSWGGAYQAIAAEGLCRALRGRDRHQLRLGRELRTRRWRSSAPRTRPATSPGTSSTSRARTGSGSATRAWRWRSTSTSGSRPATDGSTADRRTSATAWSTTATSRRSSSRRPSATAPTSPSGTARCPRTSAPSSTSRTSPASAASRSGRRRTSSGR